MKRIFLQLKNRTHTFKVTILTLFLSLISVSFLCVLSFTYSRDYKIVIQYSRKAAEELTNVILEKFTEIAANSDRVATVTAGWAPSLGEISINNKALVAFMLNVLKNNHNFSNFYVGLPNGSYFGALNQSFNPQKSYLTDPSKPLPPGTLYALRNFDNVQSPPMDYWYYLNTQFEEIGEESRRLVGHDSRSRPWYQGAVESKGLYWTGFYTFESTPERGISISNPIYDSKGELLGVIAADLTFTFLSKFLVDQKIGNTGKAFILDAEGKIIAPDLTGSRGESGITNTLVASIFQMSKANPQNPSFIFKSKGVEYLAYITKPPVIFNSDWLIVVVAPLKDFLGQMILLQQEALILTVAILLFSSLVIIYFAKRISNPMVTLAQEVNKISQLQLDSNVRVKSNIKEIFLIDNSIAAMRRVIRSFSRYVPKEIVRDLFQTNEEIILGGKKRKITIFFSDVEGFTGIAETYSIDVLIPLLSEYFNEMNRIILDSHGTIDKFLGDGIMAFWGAPIEFADHASRACTAALLCTAMLKKMNKKRIEDGKPEFITRFGINTGIVIVGNIGTEDRMNYTVIGDAVNITSRLQDVDKFYHTSIIISQDTYSELGGKFLVRPLDFVAVKGKKEKIKIYELLGKMDGEKEIEPTPEAIELSKSFSQAYDAFDRKEYKQAEELFKAILKKFPNDYPTQLYLQRFSNP
jgi:adenylate cyclase